MVIEVEDAEKVRYPWELKEMMIWTSGSRFQFETSRSARIESAILDWKSGNLVVDLGNVELSFSEDLMDGLRYRVSQIRDKHSELDAVSMPQDLLSQR